MNEIWFDFAVDVTRDILVIGSLSAFIIWGIFHEQQLIEFEDKMIEKFKEWIKKKVRRIKNVVGL